MTMSSTTGISVKRAGAYYHLVLTPTTGLKIAKDSLVVPRENNLDNKADKVYWRPKNILGEPKIPWNKIMKILESHLNEKS